MENKGLINLDIKSTYNNIKIILENARNSVYKAVNFEMVMAYWNIGKIIVQEQEGAERADYGKKLIKSLAKQLTDEFGKGFNETNLKYMREFYLRFPNSHALSDELSWTHYRLLLKVENEEALITKLQEFLLELGKGFSFVARQKRVTIDGDHYYIDLVFYNFILKCFVLIDLKIGKLTHQDIGQMDFYVRYFEQEEKLEGDNPVIGLILCSDKNDTMVKYTLLNDSTQIFASKYKLYLPTEEELKEEINKEIEFLEIDKNLIEDSD